MAFNTIIDDNPASDAVAITPSDTVNHVGGPFKMLYVGVAGNVTLVTLGGTAILFSNLPVGIHRIGFSRINATGTAATNMVGLT